MAQQKLSQSVNIMLTPQFYTLKKEKLPIKYAFQAKKIAASLFDSLLENPHSYDYFVYKEEDNWVFIAYKQEQIRTFLSSKGIEVENVGKIYFAQQSVNLFTKPVLLGQGNALVNIDKSVVVLPSVALDSDVKTLNFDDSFTPKNGIALEGSFNSFLTYNQALGVASLVTVFALIFFVEGWKYSSASDDIKIEVRELIEEYPALASQYTRQSVATKYKSIDTKERRKREMIKTLSGMIFKGVKVNTFSMNDKSFNVMFNCENVKVAKELKKLARKVGFTSVKTLTGNAVSIEEQL